MALKCNMLQTALWVWWWWTSWNVWIPHVNPFHYTIEQGPPGPPDKVTVEEITDSTAQLSWTPGRDNGSPITGYIVQARTPFTVGWQAVDTGNTDQTLCWQLKRLLSEHFPCDPLKQTVLFAVPEVINGNTLTATVVGLNAWVEYEFRVVARNTVGLGEPSPASAKTRTEDSGMWRERNKAMHRNKFELIQVSVLCPRHIVVVRLKWKLFIIQYRLQKSHH